jgi:uncharacterized protein YbaR (Trm112 family)
MVDSELLAMLCCPETRQNVNLASPAVLSQLNAQIATGTLKNRGGQVVGESIESGLIRSDGKYLYPIRNEIPIMLIDEAIPLTS